MIQKPLPVFWVALILQLLLSLGAPLAAQAGHDDYDDVDPWLGFEGSLPGPDSAAVSALLTALAGSDPLVCQLAVASHWEQLGPLG